MFDFQSKFKRQIEILGLCLSEVTKKPIITFDLAEYFQVEELTIKRDLQDLRSYGIDIHSHKNRGVCLETELPKEKLVDIILHYVGLNHNDYALDRSTSLLVEKKGISALSNLVLLQLCIDNTEIAKIDYNKMGSKIEKEKVIEPLLIFQNEGSWRLLAGSAGIMKQYLIDKVVKVKSTGQRFEKSEYKFPDLFKYSWKSWLGEEKHKIKLWLSPFWADRVNPRMLVADQKITKNEDGSVIFECTVNSLSEIAGWIVSRGEGVKVLKPDGLKKAVIDLAQGTLKNYL
ncbi:MAG: WYL domain-containing transcriptional regulator [Ignavibacterium sp.]|nr:WYL domain-containing transcriptional regulator [Ignavibacterium sp.]